MTRRDCAVATSVATILSLAADCHPCVKISYRPIVAAAFVMSATASLVMADRDIPHCNYIDIEATRLQMMVMHRCWCNGH